MSFSQGEQVVVSGSGRTWRGICEGRQADRPGWYDVSRKGAVFKVHENDLSPFQEIGPAAVSGLSNSDFSVGDRVKFLSEFAFVEEVTPGGMYRIGYEDPDLADSVTHWRNLSPAPLPEEDIYEGTSMSRTPGDPVQSPPHYDLPGGIQVIDLIRGESFLRGNLIKYVFRAPHKGNELQDMKKAAQYLKWEIERLENEQSS